MTVPARPPARDPRPTPPPGAPAGTGNWFTRGGWWFLVHVLSVGLLAPVPLVHAAVVSRRTWHAVLAVLSVVLVVATGVCIALSERTPDGHYTGSANTVGSVLLWSTWIAGTAALVVVRQQIYGRPVAPPPRHADPAIAAALDGRRRREEARRLVESDPLLARELRIGRPDLPRTYDDGGLVDLNAAPAPAVARVLGVDAVVAGAIVQARQAAGRFAAVDDVFAYAELPVETWDVVRDRGIVLPY